MTSDIALVVLTHNRCAELLRTLDKLMTVAHECAEICLVDNASHDGSADAALRRFPQLKLVRLGRNLGAAGRNHGVAAIDCRYVAFCDDDTWWEPGSLRRAAQLFDAWPRLAAITARVLVEPSGREDSTCTRMMAARLPGRGEVPGVPALGFLAGACVMRRSAFVAAGGFEPRLFIGGEERLLAVDLLAAGWRLAYVPELVVHHAPSRRRDPAARRRAMLRNALWCAWLRRPLKSAWRETRQRTAATLHEPRLAAGVLAALRGLPWVLRRRRVLPVRVESALQLLEARGQL